MAALVEYSLPNVNSPAGEFVVKVYSETAGLTVPTKQTILSIGELEETADRAPSVQEASTVRLEVADDTSTYAQGFWYHITNLGRTLVKLTLLESSVETYYFFGRVDNLQNEWTDHYVDAGSTVFVRSGSLVMTSLEKDIFEKTTAELATEVLSHRVANDDLDPVAYAICKVTRVMDIFNALLVVAGYNSTYSREDTTFVFDSSKQDFKYWNRSLSYGYDFSGLWFVCSRYTSDVVPEEDTNTPFFYGSQSWANKYHYLKDFISALLDTFQLLLRFDYDTATGRVKIKLYQRGHAAADASNAVMSKIQSRRIIVASDTIGTSFQATDVYTTSLQRWISKSYSDSVQSIAVPDYIEIGASSMCMFRAGESTTGAGTISQACNLFGSYADPTLGEYPGFVDTDASYTTSDRILTIDYFDYTSNAYVNIPMSGDGTGILSAVVAYQYGRFAEEHVSITATYKSFLVNNGSTTSQTNARTLMRTTINDGTGSASYWAKTVIKDATTNTLTVTWVKE